MSYLAYLLLFFQTFNLALIILDHGTVLKIGDLICLILHGFKQQNRRFTVFQYQTTAIPLHVAFIETIARSALGIAVLFTESGGHVLSVYVVPAIRLIQRQNSPTGDALKCPVFPGVT